MNNRKLPPNGTCSSSLLLDV